MKSTWIIVSVTLTISLTVASGIITGQLTGRWGPTGHLQAAAEKMKPFPKQIGDWEMDAELELSELAVQLLQCEEGFVQRTYINRKTQAKIDVALIVGPFGPMSIHNPDICYPDRGYSAMKKTETQRIDSPQTNGEDTHEDEFWAASFKAKQLGAYPLHVYYAWSDGGDWQAPQWARFSFGGAPALYKIQVASNFEWPEETRAENPCVDFIQDFLPIWRKELAYRPAD